MNLKDWLSPLDLFPSRKITLQKDHAFCFSKGPKGDVLFRCKSWPTDETWVPTEGISILQTPPSDIPFYVLPFPYPVAKVKKFLSLFRTRLDVITRSGENALLWWNQELKNMQEAEAKDCATCLSLRGSELESRPSEKLTDEENNVRSERRKDVTHELLEHLKECDLDRRAIGWTLLPSFESKKRIYNGTLR